MYENIFLLSVKEKSDKFNIFFFFFNSFIDHHTC